MNNAMTKYVGQFMYNTYNIYNIFMYVYIYIYIYMYTCSCSDLNKIPREVQCTERGQLYTRELWSFLKRYRCTYIIGYRPHNSFKTVFHVEYTYISASISRYTHYKDSLIFKMEISIPGETVFILKRTQCVPSTWPLHSYLLISVNIC